ncbi:hypothetical protein JZ751_007111 [Albula glossodonta]|uniref:Uncharacterized protein n=1 Tax=Albula glossodonta TaxID=121402 RepID=A0A8T2PAY0_9TELE|nr:hypothetical protein JZ751_007111 [Albula glossodonta]
MPCFTHRAAPANQISLEWKLKGQFPFIPCAISSSTLSFTPLTPALGRTLQSPVLTALHCVFTMQIFALSPALCYTPGNDSKIAISSLSAPTDVASSARSNYL